MRLGVSTLELDTQITKDKKVVVNHDRQISPQKCRDTAPVRASEVTIQSFAWGALNEMHRLAPKWPLVALTNYDFLQVGQPGASPWLGGVDADTYGGDFVKTATAAIPGLTALSPNYGFPQNGKVGDPGFRFYPDRARVSDAHARGLKVIPWTSDDPATSRRSWTWESTASSRTTRTRSGRSWPTAVCACRGPTTRTDTSLTQKW